MIVVEAVVAEDTEVCPEEKLGINGHVDGHDRGKCRSCMNVR
jgi:hypothetical protein